MNPKVELVAMDAKGIADFLMELKRTKVRHSYPFQTFITQALASCKTGEDRKTRESATWQRER